MFTCDVATIDLTPMPLLSDHSTTTDSATSFSNREQNISEHSIFKHSIFKHSISEQSIAEWLIQINDDISRELERGVNIRQLVAARACVIDELLIALFKWFELDKTDLALFATGGYGRGELSLYSDVDILLLTPDEITVDNKEKIDNLVAL